jgi:hypothetical protein
MVQNFLTFGESPLCKMTYWQIWERQMSRLCQLPLQIQQNVAVSLDTNKQNIYNLTLRRVRVTIVAVEKQ